MTLLISNGPRWQFVRYARFQLKAKDSLQQSFCVFPTFQSLNARFVEFYEARKRREKIKICQQQNPTLIIHRD